MAEYIDREKIFPNGVFYVSAENPESSLNELINRICNLPTADVVPKSEVERLEGELIVESTRRKNAVNAYHDAKTEVAREIFEEIEKITMHNVTSSYGIWLMSMGEDAFAKLKKKYTGD